MVGTELDCCLCNVCPREKSASLMFTDCVERSGALRANNNVKIDKKEGYSALYYEPKMR